MTLSDEDKNEIYKLLQMHSTDLELKKQIANKQRDEERAKDAIDILGWFFVFAAIGGFSLVMGIIIGGLFL